MKGKLLIYSLPLFLFAILFSGFSLQDHPNNIEQTSTNANLQAENYKSPVNPLMDGACTYSWAAQTSGTTSLLQTVYAVSNMIGWAGGVAGTVRRTTDGGTTWTNGNPNPGVIAGDIYNVYAIDHLTAFVTTTPTTTTFIYKTTNGGINWTQVFSQAGGFIDAIQMVSNLVGYALGDPVGGTWVILKTTNGGDNWTQMPGAPAQAGTEAGWNNSFLIVGNSAWFGTNNTRVYYTTNINAATPTWLIGATTGTLNTFAVHYNDPLNGIAGGSPTATPLVSSANGGATYSTAPAPGTAGSVNGLEGSGTEWWAIRGGASVYMSVSPITTWPIVHTQTGVVFQDIDFSTEGGCATCPAGWVVGSGGAIAKMSSTTSTLNLTINLQVCNITDMVTVELRSATSPFALIECRLAVGGLGTPQNVSFSNAVNGTSYYVVVKHKNSIESWSNPITFTGGTASYDFTSAQTQTFGSNSILVGSEWSIISGDVNQDGIVDASDISAIENDALTGAPKSVSGFPTDLNCDGFVDASDISTVENNTGRLVITP